MLRDYQELQELKKLRELGLNLERKILSANINFATLSELFSDSLRYNRALEDISQIYEHFNKDEFEHELQKLIQTYLKLFINNQGKSVLNPQTVRELSQYVQSVATGLEKIKTQTIKPNEAKQYLEDSSKLLCKLKDLILSLIQEEH
ncbi:hypothetical protein J7L02_02240 [Candidatus Woesearchaeota archaeon]|nr:hypothetical protein [Candidatus Woesearchaeota archaeon]